MAKVLVTGCNRGIGLQLCSQLHDRGDEVIGVCRSASPEISALGIRVIEGIDVSDGDNVAALANEPGVRLPGARRHESRLRAETDGIEIPIELIEKLEHFAASG